ncbi:hypothetical protein [Chengkuizengella axinellae]|uniref:Uncharacterized protein n=1 Tax=Chengkuizengella axinellae TaxID=3064388 RepID=A0ABT9J3J5_9BACL|nr:hypothetical protein [Chengkuizengella sp. 2205SS18-9]MDP5276169.1 hypothetical protein [Chengkuizengella sp. 2205SS18-9]
MYEELNKDPNNIGLCESTSLMISSILEKEGIWNYQVFGRVRIGFSADLKLRSILPSSPPFDDGHVWVVAPPFGVIDLTIKHQHYKDRIQDYLPDKIMYETPHFYAFDSDIKRLHFPTYNVLHNKNVEVTYLIDTIIKNINSLTSSSKGMYNLNGKDLLEIYNDLIYPKLH